MMAYGSDDQLQGTAAFNTGMGKKARADIRIILESIKNSTTQMRTSQPLKELDYSLPASSSHLRKTASFSPILISKPLGTG